MQVCMKQTCGLLVVRSKHALRRQQGFIEFATAKLSQCHDGPQQRSFCQGVLPWLGHL